MVVVTRNGVSMEETGIEIIKVIETADNDTLIVDPGLGDSVGRVEDDAQENSRPLRFETPCRRSSSPA